MSALADQRDIPSAVAPERRTPYQGLTPYSEQDHEYFFGRGTWRGIIADHLFAYRVTLLYGPSGVGKSSVLGAGLMHDLRDTARRNIATAGRPELVPVLVNSWSGDPLATVEVALYEAVRELAPDLAAPPPTGTLGEVLAAWAERAGGPVLLVLDQFDEFFTYHDGDGTTGGFALVDALADAVGDAAVAVNLLISIREDALAKLDRFEGRLPELWQNLLRIDHLDCNAAREAIERPIARWNERDAAGEDVALEAGLVERVLAETDTRSVHIGKAGRGVLETPEEHDASEGLIEAPYLQLVMTRLWEDERAHGSRTLHVDTLNRMGGSDQIVRRHFDAVMRSLSRRHRAVAARILEYLVTPAGTKIALPAGALAKWAKQKEPKVEAVLSMLASGDRRILRTVSAPGDESGAPSYEIFHDRLAAGILDWRRRFVRRRRRNRAVIVGTLVLLLAAGAGAIVLAHQRSSYASQISVLNNKVYNERRGLALVVRRQARLSPYFLAFLPPTSGSVGSVAVSPDGARVLVGASDGRVVDAAAATGKAVRTIDTGAFDGGVSRVVFDPTGMRIGVETGEAWGGVWSASGRIAKVGAASRYNTLAFTRDGRRIISASSRDQGVVVVHDLRTGEVVQRYGRRGGMIGTVLVSRDGALVAAAAQNHVRIWSTATGRLLHTFTTRTRPVALAFSHDGMFLVTVCPKQALLWSLRTGRSTALAGAPRSIGGNDEGGEVGRIVDAGASGLVAVVTARGTVISDLAGHRVAVARAPDATTFARFSPDGSVLATGGSDGVTRLWNARTAKLLAVLRAQTERIAALAFSRDGGRLVTGSDDGTSIVWKLEPDLAITSVRFLRRTVAVANRGVSTSSAGGRVLFTSGRTTAAVPLRALAAGTSVTVAAPDIGSIARVRVEPRGPDSSRANDSATFPVIVGGATVRG